MRNNRKGALPDNRQGSPVLSARQHAAAAQPRPPRTVTYPSAEQAQPPQHLGIHIPHRLDASDNPTSAGPQRSNAIRQRHSRHFPAAARSPTPSRRLGPPYQRRSPMLHLSAATHPRHSRHSPAAAHRLHTVPTPRTTPLTQEHAPRRALPRLTAGPQCSNSPSQLARLIQGTPLPPHNGSTVPTPRTIPPTPEPATRRALPHLTAGTQRSNIPPQLASAIQDTSPPPHNGPHTIPTPRTTPPTPGPAPRRAQKNPALRAGPIHLSVIFQ